ncbi:hypothetical protein ARMGADRAFT_1122076 [Armillaria gallica]|uniref:CoA carboxyltransferase C-terminal domain-containing protein n=1 Tax=Armillaria gallica TaxID=47427 RepID=A0A2H3D9F8_ARMGA|nr:hypothetical protein ARMGADRAFT_1122076 [Armillaria gallica]
MPMERLSAKACCPLFTGRLSIGPEDDDVYRAQAIFDFEREGLPLIIFANWHGFSGGQQDMYEEVLKEGSKIVDGLSSYKQPIFIYIVPNGELRGGAWVILDPSIDKEQIEMYANVNGRASVLEPDASRQAAWTDGTAR